jgi:cytochrome c-type biogenesis protein CcmE
MLMDLAKKRQIRLFVALGFALLLATGLVYTSFNASSEAREPSELGDAVPGKSYELTGMVTPGTIKKDGEGIRFKVSDRDGSGSIPVTYEGVVPDPFRDGREIVLKGSVDENGTFVGERDTLVTKCPSKFSEKKNQ